MCVPLNSRLESDKEEGEGLGSDVGDVAEIGALRAEQLANDREAGVRVVQLDEHLPWNQLGSCIVYLDAR